MIPSDHFVRYYNEVFKVLQEMGEEHLVAYWQELGRLQITALAERFRAGGLQAVYDYWERIRQEENCLGTLTLTEDYFEFQMHRCPSLSKAQDNDATACDRYCDHCMGWVQPLMEEVGLHAAHDIHSRTEPHCCLRVYRSAGEAVEFEREARLLCRPYMEAEERGIQLVKRPANPEESEE